jgi:hypothetical protein
MGTFPIVVSKRHCFGRPRMENHSNRIVSHALPIPTGGPCRPDCLSRSVIERAYGVRGPGGIESYTKSINVPAFHAFLFSGRDFSVLGSRKKRKAWRWVRVGDRIGRGQAGLAGVESRNLGLVRASGGRHR